MTGFSTYEVMAAAATGCEPYPWQSRVARDGLPDVIAVETGAGKTAAVVLAWLWRRRYHPDTAVRAATPHWLVICLPMRVLTEQVESAVREWLAALGLGGSGGPSVHVVMGGREGVREGSWRMEPHEDAVVIGTVDMLLSRALNRGYAMGRFSWPIDFGLLHNGCHWVFDEIQLLGPALPTSRQLDGFRRSFGTAVGTSSTWMSATVDRHGLDQVDRPFDGSDVVIELGQEDREGGLARRLRAERTVEEVSAGPSGLAGALVAAHREATLSVAILNTVKAAREVFGQVRRIAPDVPVTLLHSRFRPEDRQRATEEALGAVGQAGRIVIATQVLEAGVDLSASTMLIEAASWPSVVQRAGRCNRDGEAPAARLLWTAPVRPAPYRQEDVQATVAALRSLEGVGVTTTELRRREVETSQPLHPLLRRSDLLGLFDTAPDLSGNDIDVGPFIRTPGDVADVLVAWRDLGGQRPSLSEDRPGRRELCPAPADDLVDLIRRGQAAWRYDHLSAAWDPVRPQDAMTRPGLVVVVDTHVGCYDPIGGWDSKSRVPVDSLVDRTEDLALVAGEEAIEDDRVSYGTWVALERHLGDVEREIDHLIRHLAPTGLATSAIHASLVAGRLHDVGKAHAIFQDTMRRSLAPDAPKEVAEKYASRGPWAKSGGAQSRHKQRHFRHELASALTLLQVGDSVLAGIDGDLVMYLVAAHHGRIRMSLRSMPDESLGVVLGVKDGDLMPEVRFPGGTLPSTPLSLEVVRMGRTEAGVASWSERAGALLDSHGPFRLGFLEAVVRLGDWRASRFEAQGEGDL